MADIGEMLAGLNGPQKEAVLEFDHPLLVLAGAGSGKTRVITTKIAYAIRELGIPSFKILAVTFTNKAAGEMQERVLKMVGDAEADSHATVRTFHGFGASMLRRFSDKAGLSPRFSIYDDSDSFELLKKTFPDQDPKILRQQSRKIGLLKDKGVTPAMVRGGGDAQLAQFSALEQMTNVAEGLEKTNTLVSNIDSSLLVGQLSSMIGQKLQWTTTETVKDADGNAVTDANGKAQTTKTTYEGTVTGVSISDGSPSVIAKDTDGTTHKVVISDITRVGDGSTNSTAAS